MKRHRVLCAAFASVALRAIAVPASVEPVPAEGPPPDEFRLRIVLAEASASLGEPYTPDRICDGDRRTKWVSPLRPSSTQPQWVTLTLAQGPRLVTGLALFGERVDNDGVLDADIQVETAGGFRTVASVRDASSDAWLARFEPVPASKVRLLVLRSGGPTDHTDIWEVELWGPPLSEAAIRARLTDATDRLGHLRKSAEQQVQRAASVPGAFPAGARHLWTHLTNRWTDFPTNPRAWDALPAAALTRQFQEVEDTAHALARFETRLERRTAVLSKAPAPPTQPLLPPDPPEGPPGVVEAQRHATADVLSNGHLAVAWDPARAAWSAAWAGHAAPAIRGARFSVEVDDAALSGTPDSTQVQRFQDPLGSGQALVQVWRQGRVRIERELSVYDGRPVLTLGGRMVNEGPTDVRLGTVHLLQLGAEGSWSLGTAWESPAAIYLQGHSLLRSRPFPSEVEPDSERAHDYRSSGVLALVSRDPAGVLVIGYVRADEASPDVSATFRSDTGGTALTAASRFLGRVLGPGETLELNRLYLAAGPDPFRALEDYGDALARFSPSPARTGATSLWCSWYAHRMGMTEEKVLANAAAAAKHLQPLGLEIMQLDHGWQRGDITGDWVPNERFPHGLRWLADELERRHGLRLGVWIAPTDVAETSALYREHPDWMLRGADGQPRVNWRWYWVPNPNCYELDATQPAAYREIVETFRRLTAEGVRYYKIDFIAAAAGEHFVPHDPKATRGWSPLRRAMEAIREGAGDQAWIRYCQTPPLLSAGLANSAYGGDDTLDAGIPGRFDVLRDNAHALAAGWWLNDRPYHREVCDMSVRMQGSVEEVRVRAALMTLANCSISWSDELCYLPPSRIRLMQQCLPPGNPPMRPLDLFRRAVPSVWHLKLTNAAETWDAVGLFNFESAPEVRAVRFAELGLDPQAEFAVFEFWEERFLGLYRGGVEMTLPGESSRILSLRRVTGRPQLVGTDMHLLQGWHEIKDLTWDPAGGVLAGVYQRMPGITGKAFVLVPPGYVPRFEFPLGPASARLTHVEGPLWMQEIEFTRREHPWRIPFDMPKPAPAREPAGHGT